MASPPTVGFTQISDDPDFVAAKATIDASGERDAAAISSRGPADQLVIGTDRIEPVAAGGACGEPSEYHHVAPAMSTIIGRTSSHLE